ncbi:MAG: hypothetical protein ACK58L_16945 [Planctomycetota bacterium]
MTRFCGSSDKDFSVALRGCIGVKIRLMEAEVTARGSDTTISEVPPFQNSSASARESSPFRDSGKLLDSSPIPDHPTSVCEWLNREEGGLNLTVMERQMD